MTNRRSQIATAFGRARDYDSHAVVQREVARWLGERIAATGPHRRVLEIGCGTGQLAAFAAQPSGALDWLLTDIAPAMVERCRNRLGTGFPFRYAVLDGERPDLLGERGFDLVCSSLAAQWFDDLGAALARQLALVQPGGRLLLTVLTSDTFAAWRGAVAAAGGTAGTMALPPVEALPSACPAGATMQIESRRFTSPPDAARSLLRSVKEIGAGTPRAGYAPLPAPVLRDAMRRFDAAGGVLGYEVALLDIQLRS